MQIEYKKKPPYPDVVVSGDVVNIDDTAYDLAKMQQDSERIINIKDGGQRFVANIIIPPKIYNEVDSGETDTEGYPVLTRQAEQLDMAKARLVIWQKYIKPVNEEIMI